MNEAASSTDPSTIAGVLAAFAVIALVCWLWSAAQERRHQQICEAHRAPHLVPTPRWSDIDHEDERPA